MVSLIFSIALGNKMLYDKRKKNRENADGCTISEIRPWKEIIVGRMNT
jgi:hypothetical protein